MTNTKRAPLTEIEPQLVLNLKELLIQAGEVILAAQVEHLSVFDQVDSKYGSDFYTAPRNAGPWGPRHRTLGLLPGELHIDVVGDEIVLVEVLRR